MRPPSFFVMPRIRVLISLVFALVLAAGTVVMTKRAAPLPQLPLRISSAIVDFGTLSSRQLQPPIAITITNVSSALAEIRLLDVGCGCISVSASLPAKLSPGDSLNAYVKLDEHRMTAGSHSYSLVAISPDGKRLGECSCQYIFRPFLSAPDTVVLINNADTPGVLAGTVSVDATSTVGETFEVHTSTNAVKAILLPTASVSEQNTIKVAVEIPTALAKSAGESSIVVRRLNHPEDDARIALDFEESERNLLTPSRLFLGTVWAGDVITREISISGDGLPLDRHRQIVALDQGAAPVRVQVEGLRIIVTFNPHDEGPLEGTLKIRIDQDSIEIPYAGIVKAR